MVVYQRKKEKNNTTKYNTDRLSFVYKCMKEIGENRRKKDNTMII